MQWIESLVRAGLAYKEVNAVKSAKFEIFSPLSKDPLWLSHYIQYLIILCNYAVIILIVIGNFLLMIFILDKLVLLMIQLLLQKFKKTEDLINIFDFFKQFEQLIGIKLNNDKTEILDFGNNIRKNFDIIVRMETSFVFFLKTKVGLFKRKKNRNGLHSKGGVAAVVFK